MSLGIEKIEKVLDTIEDEICEKLDDSALAASLALSLYEFRRIFAFVVGCPLSDYVRRRRLSLAACELLRERSLSVGAIGEKYGYATSAAFSRAFREFHGLSPSAARAGAGEITVFPRPRFSFRVESNERISYRILTDTAFGILGYTAPSDPSDTVCCERVWKDFYARGEDGRICSDTLYVSYFDKGEQVLCTIGERRTDGGVAIEGGRWLAITINTTDDDLVNEKYNEILCDLMPSVGLLRRAGAPTVEVYPRNMEEDGFSWEIRVPIE